MGIKKGTLTERVWVVAADKKNRLPRPIQASGKEAPTQAASSSIDGGDHRRTIRSSYSTTYLPT